MTNVPDIIHIRAKWLLLIQIYMHTYYKYITEIMWSLCNSLRVRGHQTPIFTFNPDYTGVLHVGRFAWGFLSYVISLIFKKSESFFQNASYDDLTTEM